MYERITLNIGGGTLRKETLEGREHYVVPAAMIEEGVWAGSGGALFYPSDEIRKSTPTWNHKPLVVYHPTSKDGVPISACNPVVLNTRKIGLVLDTTFDTKLRTECWIDIEKTKSVDQRILTALEKGETVEVSTGLYTDNEEVAGEWNGKKYVATARNYRPDHLAVLPDKVGAYSVKDGGGLLQVNQSREPERTQNVMRRSVEQALKTLGYTLTDNELSHSQIHTQLADLLAGKFGQPGKYWGGYICEIYSDRVVFKNDYGPNSQLMMIEYAVDGETVSLVGEAVAVERVVEYRETEGGARYTANASGILIRETEMAFSKKDHITSLIANNTISEADRARYEALPDDVLEKIKPTVNSTSASGAAASTTEAPKVTPEQYIANADPTTREVLQEAVNALNAEKARLTEDIVKHPANQFRKEDLLAAPVVNLRAIHALLPKHPTIPEYLNPLIGPGAQPIANNYVGAVGVPPVLNSVPETMLPTPEMHFASPFATRK